MQYAGGDCQHQILQVTTRSSSANGTSLKCKALGHLYFVGFVWPGCDWRRPCTLQRAYLCDRSPARLEFHVVGYFLPQAAFAEFAGVGSIRASLYLSMNGVLKGVGAAGESTWAV